MLMDTDQLVGLFIVAPIMTPLLLAFTCVTLLVGLFLMPLFIVIYLLSSDRDASIFLFPIFPLLMLKDAWLNP